MTTSQRQRLELEPLEARRLLAGVIDIVDVDGDPVRIRLTGPGDFDVTLTEVDQGERIDAITLFDTTSRSKLIVKAGRGPGDGYVDVDTVDGVGQELNQLFVEGNLGFLEIDSVRKINAHTTAASIDESDADWIIDDNVRSLVLRGSLEYGKIEINGDLRRAIIHGDIYQASLVVDGMIRVLHVRSDVAEDSLIFARDGIGKLLVRGNLDFSNIETNDLLGRVTIRQDVFDSVIFGNDGIRRIVVDGGVADTTIESSGGIGVIDVWNWIENTDLIAGPQGINTVFAYDIDNLTLSGPGDIKHLLLDNDPLSGFAASAHQASAYVQAEAAPSPLAASDFQATATYATYDDYLVDHPASEHPYSEKKDYNGWFISFSFGSHGNGLTFGYHS